MRARKKPRIGECVLRPDGRTAQFVRERDDEDKPAEHFRVMDTLALLLKNNAISQEMHDAGRMFEADFHRANLTGLRAQNLERLACPAGGDSPTEHAVYALDLVHRALDAVGGISGPSGLALWNVVGLGASLREWSSMQRWAGRTFSEREAKGILIAALGMLDRHYGLTIRPGKIRALSLELQTGP